MKATTTMQKIMPRKIIIGNWKMNLPTEGVATFLNKIQQAQASSTAWVGIAAPACEFDAFSHQQDLLLLAQNSYSLHPQGAYTGEISNVMLKAHNVDGVIIGHSERRTIFHEDNALIQQKVQKTLADELIALLCVGDPLAIYEENKTKQYVLDQLEQALKALQADDLKRLIIAYEPIWAIGTGKTATSAFANQMIICIKTWLEKHFGSQATDVPVLYGGSVNPANFKELLNHEAIDGLLVGGASLTSSSFSKLLAF